LDAATIGQVTGDGILRVRNHGAVVAEIPNRALADEAPLYDRPHTKPYRPAPMESPEIPASDPKADLIALLSSGDICSKRWIWEQYDFTVRTNTLQGPGTDAAIIRIKETGTSVAMSVDGNGRYCLLDPREGIKLLVAECCRNLSTVGALPVAATNNLNFGNPERPEIMAQLVETIEGMSEACTFFETPITGGNVSLYNETLGEGIFPTPVMGIVGLLKTALPPPMHFQNADRAVMLLGSYGDCDTVHFGGSQYAKTVVKSLWGLPPVLDMGLEKRVQQAVREIVAEGLAESAHDLSDGGFAVTMAECSFGPKGIGACVYLDQEGPLELVLFHEAPSRIIVSTNAPKAVQQIAFKHGVVCTQIGNTKADRLEISNRKQWVIDCAVSELKQPWENSLERLLNPV
jgi:phosphoribosylformylglycinamidine (FGAM) synthase-like enzyme